MNFKKLNKSKGYEFLSWNIYAWYKIFQSFKKYYYLKSKYQFHIKWLIIDKTSIDIIYDNYA